MAAMRSLREREIFTRDLRANPGYELVLSDRLEPELRRALANLEQDSGFYGVLRPAPSSPGGRGGGWEERAGEMRVPDGPALSLKSVDRDTALLFLSLREPGPLPAYVRRMAGEGAARVAAQLVADGILEIAAGDGAFVSGAAAFGLLWEEGAEGRGGRLAELSLAALRYGQALALAGTAATGALADPLRLSLRLYGYNRRPLTPAWKRRLADAAAVERHLGIGPGGLHRRRLDQGWSRTGSSETWLSWRRRGSDRDGGGLAAAGATWKLYVSPQPEALADGFGRILDALTAARAPQIKVGAGAAGLLRPDKMVAYFGSFERLAAAADAVTERLGGTPAQGVPFTSEIGGDGLLSWGVDPPAGPWSGGESWRLWLTHRLAVALLAGKLAGKSAETAGVEPWRFALERLRLEGVDTDSWTPGGRLFREA
ncbi:MAG TPA: hypothetical protein VFC23_10290 [Thermoanaerobaculia bacterium]|nr:hypothetical protein [Thermoanaerobaculia bacterium]